MVDGLYSTGDRQQGQVHYNKALRITGQNRLLEQNTSGKYIFKNVQFSQIPVFYFPKISAISKLCSSILCVKSYFLTEKKNPFMLLEVVPNKMYTEGKSLPQRWPSRPFTFKSPTSRSPALHLFSLTSQMQAFTKSCQYVLKSPQIRPFLLICAINWYRLPYPFLPRQLNTLFTAFSTASSLTSTASNVFKTEIRTSYLRLKTMRSHNVPMRYCTVESWPAFQFHPVFLTFCVPVTLAFLQFSEHTLALSTVFIHAGPLPCNASFLLNNLGSSFGSLGNITSLSLTQSGSDIPVNNLCES